MASSFRTFARSIWYLKSGPLSITILAFGVSIQTEARSLLLRLSGDVHTTQSHPMKGTPCDVPVPRNVTFILYVYFGLCGRRILFRRWFGFKLMVPFQHFSAQFTLYNINERNHFYQCIYTSFNTEESVDHSNPSVFKYTIA